MYNFPKNLYTDIRIEETTGNTISYHEYELRDVREDLSYGAFIRIFDGEKWYYSSTTDIENLQHEINILAKEAKPNSNILEHETIRKMQINEDEILLKEERVDLVELTEKRELIENYFYLFNNKNITSFKTLYRDKYIKKTFLSSLGARVKQEKQYCGLLYMYTLSFEDEKLNESTCSNNLTFSQLWKLDDFIKKDIKKKIDYIKKAKPVEPGDYTVILSPRAAGVFAHESFGHKSEADNMIGDEALKKGWYIGKKTGSEILNIIDDGDYPGMGQTLYDDEGTKAQKSYLIKDGILSGRLHSCETAADLNEETTGNARAIDFEWEPIVRMTSTYIDKGKHKMEEIIQNTDEGILIENYKYGTGGNTFTIAPSIAYMIKNGKIAYPVKVSFVSGSVFETLENIDMISDELDMRVFTFGGCGKGGQMPLPVNHGGPYVRVKKMKVM